jgi:hypothetical protein
MTLSEKVGIDMNKVAISNIPAPNVKDDLTAFKQQKLMHDVE